MRSKGMGGIGKTTFREIKASFGRFMAIFAIIALGVGFFAGLKVTKEAMMTTVRNYLNQYGFQDFRLVEKKTVQGNLEFAMRTVGASGREMRKRIPYVLDLVGLKEKADAYPNEMSGGEQQRVAIARALVNNPRMIIADEPTGNLDPKRSLEIMTLLERINSMGTTVLVVTHEKDLVNRFSKRVVAIKDGEMVRDGQGGYYRV